MNVSIIGAGIAGLCTAIALKKQGMEIQIFEGAAEIKPAGAGLALAANAMKGLQQMGIAEDVVKAGRLIPSFTIYDQKKKVITVTDSFKLSRKYGIDNFTIHRAPLHRVLLSSIDSTVVHTGKKAVDFKKTEAGIFINFEDGSTYRTDALIVADGIHSMIRQKLVPGSLPRYAGYTCWRGVTNNNNLGINVTSETWATQGRFGIVPLADNQLYWFACINAPRNSDKFKKFTIKDLKEHFSDFHQPIPELIDATADKDLIHNDILYLKPLERYAFDNIVLIGDAAHATTPNMGQGACQAIEDAVVLADEITKNRSLELAFKIFEKRRLKRTHYITEQSYRIGKIAQTSNRLLAMLRNTFLRMLPESAHDKRFEQLYKTDF